MPVILASGSPRRTHLLRLLGVEHQIIPSQFEEYAVQLSDFPTQEEYVQAVAAGKILDVTERCQPEDVIIGGDLVTFLDGELFHKPRNFSQAEEFFRKFCGRWHDEIAALGTWSQERGLIVRTERARVYTPTFSDEQIRQYLTLAEPLDKSGGYSVAAAVRTLGKTDTPVLVEGPITAVLGFPVELAAELLRTAGIHVPVNATTVEAGIRQDILFPLQQS